MNIPDLTDDDTMDEIECQGCSWIGHVSELLCRDEDLGKQVMAARYDQCPNCGDVDSCEDLE